MTAAALSLSAAVVHASSWNGAVVERDGVQYVTNPATSVEPMRILEPRELWRLDSSDAVVGAIGGFERDDRGYTFLLDVQLEAVHVVDPGGSYVGVIGGPGEGPAEFRMASGIALLNDTTVCVTQAVPARAVLMTPDGRSIGDHKLPPDVGTAYLNGCAAVGGRLAVRLGQMVYRETSITLKTSFGTVDSDGRIATTYWERFQSADFANMEFDEKADFEPVWAVGADGRFYVADNWDAYSIQVVGPDGNVLHVFSREYPHRPRGVEELARVKARALKGEIAPDTKVADTSPDISRIMPQDDGTVWVLSSRGEMDAPEGTIAVFDVFDSSGRFVQRAALKGPFLAGRDVFVAHNDVVVITTNAGEFVEALGEEATATGDESRLVCIKFDDISHIGSKE